MGVSTPIRGLYKPAKGEIDWDQQVNSNFDNLDATANTSYVNSGDASTLSSAKAYTDSAVSGVSAPVTSVAGKTGAVLLVEADIANLPADLAAKASLVSPVFTGTPTAPTPAAADNSTKIATTAFVDSAVAGISFPPAPVTSVAGKTGAVTLVESDITGLVADLAATEKTANKGQLSGYASLDATGNVPAAQLGNVPAAPVTSVATKTGAVTLVEADIANLPSDLAAKAPLASPVLTGAPTAPTPTAGDNSANIATTAFVHNAVGSGGGGTAPVASTVQKQEAGSDPSLLSFTPPATIGIYRLSVALSVATTTAPSGFSCSVSFQDSNSHAQSFQVPMFKLGQNSANINFASGLATGIYYFVMIIDVDNSGTPIVVFTTFTGTAVAYKATAILERLA